MNDTNAKQKIIERIKDVTNILVTVSADPSADELSAALAITLFLNKLEKHATAVVSGAIPSAVQFLEPKKTFERTVDSLRDFIVALDKEKADHLRYVLDGDVVKIYITPYRTTISEGDLEFSQGDYNVELVIAIGVKDEDHLDAALSAHGRILHDATVATITAGDTKSTLGSIDWHSGSASSVSELAADLLQSLKSGAAKIDEQIATALLTGVVAETDRFSNAKTSANVMTLAAQLMAAGANQQLVATKIEEANANDAVAETDNEPTPAAKKKKKASEFRVARESNDAPKKTQPTVEQSGDDEARDDSETPADEPRDGELQIEHELRGTLDEVSAQVTSERREDAAEAAEEKLRAQTAKVAGDEPAETAQVVATSGPTIQDQEDELSKRIAPQPAELPTVAPPTAVQPQGAPQPAPTAPTLSIDDLQRDLQKANADINQASQALTNNEPVRSVGSQDQPTFGGTLNATTEAAAEAARAEEDRSRNGTILSHSGYIASDAQPTYSSPMNGASITGEPSSVDPFMSAPGEATFSNDERPTVKVAPQLEIPAPSEPVASFNEYSQQFNQAHSEARAEIDGVFSSSSDASLAFEPLDSQANAQNSPQTPIANAPAMPPLPDFSTLPPLPNTPQPAPYSTSNDSTYAAAPQQQYPAPDESQFTQASLPPLEFGVPQQASAAPTENYPSSVPQSSSPEPQPSAAQQSTPANPNQFRIPGQ